jgi:hypothetical protein
MSIGDLPGPRFVTYILDHRDRAMEALVYVFLLLGGIVSETTLLGDR